MEISRTAVDGVPVSISLAGESDKLAVLSRKPASSVLTWIDTASGNITRKEYAPQFLGSSVIGFGEKVLATGRGGGYLLAGRDGSRVGTFPSAALGNTMPSEPALESGRIFILFNGNGEDCICSFGPSAPPARPLKCVPNPFNPAADISFFLKRKGRVRLSIFDAAGRRVMVLADRDFSAGEHSVRWNGCTSAGDEAATGVYFCRMESQHSAGTVKMVLLR
jgi:hypothetical protein